MDHMCTLLKCLDEVRTWDLASDHIETRGDQSDTLLSGMTEQLCIVVPVRQLSTNPFHRDDVSDFLLAKNDRLRLRTTANGIL